MRVRKYISWASEKRNRDDRREAIIEEIVTKKTPNLTRNIAIQTHEVISFPKWQIVFIKNPAPEQSVAKLLITKDKGILKIRSSRLLVWKVVSLL